MKNLLLSTRCLLLLLLPVPSYAADAVWFDDTGPATEGTAYNFFDSTRWDGGARPSSGDNVSIRLMVPWDLSDPLNVPNILRNQDYAIDYNPLNNTNEPNTVTYRNLDYRATSFGNSTFTQQSGIVKIENIFRVGGGQAPIEMSDVGGVDYHFGGATTYRIEGGILDLRNSSGTSEIGSSGPGAGGPSGGAEGYNAQFELAGGTVKGHLSIGESGNGRYLQTGGVFQGTSLSVGRDDAYTGDHPEDLNTASLTLRDGLIDIDYMTTGGYYGSGNINILGGTLLLDTDHGNGIDLNKHSHIKLGRGNYAADMVIGGSARINPDADINLPGTLLINTINGMASTVTQGGTSVARFFRVNNDGRYEMNGGLLESMWIDNIGGFVQNGGTVKATAVWRDHGNIPAFWLGGELNSTGRYTMNGGEIDSRALSVFGPFNMNGGVINTESLYIAGTVPFNMNGGTVNAGSINTGSFSMIGGLINADTLSAAGTYDMSNGITSAKSLQIGGLSTFNQTDGAVFAGLFGNADANIGTLITNGGKYHLSGGSLTSTEMQVDAGGSINQTGGASSVGNLNNSGHVIVRDGRIQMDDLNNNGNANFLSNATTTINGNITNGSTGVLNFGNLADTVTIKGASSENSGVINIVNSNVVFDNNIYSEKGMLRITGTSAVDTGNLYLGIDAGTRGEISVDGPDASLTAGTLVAGVNGEGSLSLDNGASFSSHFAHIGQSSFGEVTLDNGSRWDNAKGVRKGIFIGTESGNSDGHLRLNNGSELTSGEIELAGRRGPWARNSKGTLSISGGSRVDTDKLTVGNWGKGTLIMNSAATMNSGTTSLAKEARSEAHVTISGAGTRWEYAGTLNVAEKGKAWLKVEDGAKVSGRDMYVAGDSTSEANIWVTGAGSKLTSLNGFFVDDDGKVQVVIENGGLIESDFAFFNAHEEGNLLNAIVDGNGSQWRTHRNLEMGYSRGVSEVTARNGGRITIGTELNIGEKGRMMVGDKGTLESTSAVNAGGQVGVASGGTVTMTGDYRQTDENEVGAETKVNGTMTAKTLTFEGGLLSGSGDIFGDVEMLEGSEIGPGNSPGWLTINGDFLLGAGSTYTIEIGDYAAIEYDKLFIEGTATIEDGAIFDIVFLDTFIFDPLEEFGWDFIDATDFVFGDFDNVIFNVSGLSGTDFDYPMDFESGFNTIDVSTGPSTVPVPPTIWLFGTALIGLIGFNKRKLITA